MGFVKYKEKEKQIIVKTYDDECNFIKSIFIPSTLYPLSHNKYRIFHDANTSEITDKYILHLIDTIKYQIGHCYTMSESLLNILKEYDIKCYSGWLFLCGGIPIYHCWCVLDDKHIIDLSSDHENISTYMIENELEPTREMYAKVFRMFMSMQNTDRVPHIGKATSNYLYVGCEDTPSNARRTFRSLKEKYPNHESDLSVGGVGTPSPIQMEITNN